MSLRSEAFLCQWLCKVLNISCILIIPCISNFKYSFLSNDFTKIFHSLMYLIFFWYPFIHMQGCEESYLFQISKVGTICKDNHEHGWCLLQAVVLEWAESQFLWLHHALSHSVAHLELLWTIYSCVWCTDQLQLQHMLSPTFDASHWCRKGICQPFCFLPFTCWNFADIHCRTEISFSIPSILCVEK